MVFILTRKTIYKGHYPTAVILLPSTYVHPLDAL
jgi:hypothetical protein